MSKSGTYIGIKFGLGNDRGRARSIGGTTPGNLVRPSGARGQRVMARAGPSDLDAGLGHRLPVPAFSASSPGGRIPRSRISPGLKGNHLPRSSVTPEADHIPFSRQASRLVRITAKYVQQTPRSSGTTIHPHTLQHSTRRRPPERLTRQRSKAQALRRATVSPPHSGPPSARRVLAPSRLLS